uniref:Uncharacterized protein MANES_04G000300 n=1 Tax=Rhizophora mucronata TaxID=61149 RepID=A0A2P2KN12_RHIMU
MSHRSLSSRRNNRFIALDPILPLRASCNQKNKNKKKKSVIFNEYMALKRLATCTHCPVKRSLRE